MCDNSIHLFKSKELRRAQLCHEKAVELPTVHSVSNYKCDTESHLSGKKAGPPGPNGPQDLQDLQDPKDPRDQGFLGFQEQLLWDHPALQVLLVLKDPLASKDLLVSSSISPPS